jgi:hypothetical protein
MFSLCFYIIFWCFSYPLIWKYRFFHLPVLSNNKKITRLAIETSNNLSFLPDLAQISISWDVLEVHA